MNCDDVDDDDDDDDARRKWVYRLVPCAVTGSAIASAIAKVGFTNLLTEYALAK